MARQVIILFLAVLVAVVTGCGGAHRYDGRLVQADSLMQANPDSALALVEAVNADSLVDEGDRAYRDLLLTQARYKCYITATTDSDINRALAYYRNHSREREKLTRAYIYKGAVMQELGHPDSAMYYYKTAEATAAPDDYANLGYTILRIADLYRMYYADDVTCFDKYQSALHFFKLTGNKRLQQNCLFNMAVCTSKANTDDPLKYLEQAIAIATELDDNYWLFICKEYQSRTLLLKDSNSVEAKQIAMECLHQFDQFVNHDLLMDLANIYALEHMNDSAQYYLNLMNGDYLSMNAQIRLRYYWVLFHIALNKNDTIKSHYYRNLISQISDSIDNSDTKNSIQLIENTNNKKKEESKELRISHMGWLIVILGATLVVALLLLLLSRYLNNRRIAAVMNEIHHAHISEHEELLKHLEEKDSTLGLFVNNMVNLMQTSIDTSQHDTPKVMKRRINEAISSMVNDEFWQELRAYLNKKHNNLIDRIAKNPKITEVDLRFIELTCFGFNYIEIAVIMNYSPNYISKKRKSIAKKLGIKMTLEDYLSRFISQDSSSIDK